ncbi:MAG: UDP-N-acetylglucosamine 2-epimerase [Gammaproteobacteria bacterium RIFCSPHIGHO2_12_FULL_37_14]|nr:MAG: UDP-N-acetylglucosamine 2-epimerase [Gammaproteobacteria bacterium RIFCSPHIGHO2_12_FULL_37_14]
MQRLKVMTIVGTRPEIIKLSRVIAELEKYTHHILVHTGQNFDYELNEIFFRDLELRKPDYFLQAADENAAKTIGQVIIKTDEVLEIEKPDAILVYGDTNSCLAVIAAKRRKIPIFHMEAGNRCFDQRVPEEINRKILDHISDVNLTLSEHARRYLLDEGLHPETTFKVGSSMREVFNYYKPGIQASTILEELNLSSGGYFIVSAHREENVDSQGNLVDLLTALNAITKNYDKRVIVSTHPRTRMRLKSLHASNPLLEINEGIQFLKPFGFLDYAKLQSESFCVLSDSGSLTEDSSILDFPAITIRQAHERPEGMDVATILMSGLKAERVMQAIDMATSQHVRGRRNFAMVPDYNVDDVSRKVPRIILSYVDYINSTVWHKAPEENHVYEKEPI